MSRGNGIQADDVMQKEALKRIQDYQVGVNEMIKVNIELEKISRERLALGKKTLKNSKEHAKLTRLENEVNKKRASIGRELNKQAKLNSDITKYANNKQLNSIKLKKELNTREKELIESISKNTKAVRKNQSQWDKFKSRLKNFFSPANIGIGVVIASLYKLWGTINETIALIKKLDSLEMSMGVALREDQDALERTMGKLTIMSYKYGQNLLTLTERYNKFLVASKSSNISLSDTENIFETVTKASAVLGLSNEELKGSLLAIEQMMSKGKITTEELRRQLGERMPGAVGIMADAMGVGIEELGKMMKKGEVMTKEVLPAFAEAMKDAYNLDTVEDIDTLIAAQERSNTAWTEMVRSMDDGHGAISDFLKIWNSLKESFFKYLTVWNEKQIGRKFFAAGVNAANEYLEGYASVKTDKIKGFDKLSYVDQLKVKKALKLAEAKDKINESLHDVDDNGELLPNLPEQIKQAERDLNTYINSLKKIEEDYKKKGVSFKIDWSTFFGFAPTEQNAKNDDNFIKLKEVYRKKFEELKELKGAYDKYYRLTKEDSNGNETVIDNIKDKVYKARLLTKPLLKEFNEYGKSLKVILKSEVNYFKNKIKTASTYKDMVKYLNLELRTRTSILKVTKKQNDLKVESRYKKELQQIAKKRTAYENIKRDNDNKANEIIEKLNKKAENYEETVLKVKKQFYTPNIEAYNAILDRSKKEIELKYEYDLNYNRTVYQDGLNQIRRQRVERNLQLIQRSYNEELKLNKNKDAQKTADKLKSLEEDMTAKKINIIDYEHEKERIELESSKRKIKREIDAQKKLLQHSLDLHNEYFDYIDKDGIARTSVNLVPNATPQQIEEITAKLKEYEQALASVGLTISKLDTDTQVYFQKIEAFINKFSSQFNDMLGAIRESVNLSYQADIDAQDKRLKNLKDYYDKQNELAGDSEYKKKLLREEEEIATKKIEDKKRKLRIKQAEADKKFAIFDASMGAAQAIVNVFAHSSPPYSFILAGMIAATTAIKISNIKKQKIPEYKLGTDYHPKTGFAIVGDGGKQEVVESRGETYLTPDRPTLTYLYKGDKVYKDKADYIKNKANKLLDNSIKNDTFAIGSGNVEDAILQGFKLVKNQNNISISIQNNNPYKAFKKL